MNAEPEQQWWQCPFDDEWTLSHLLHNAGDKFGNCSALAASDGRVYSHLDICQRSAGLSQAIQSATPEGSIIASLTSLDLSCFVAVRAAMTSGRVLAPLDALSPDERNRDCIELCGARAIVTNVACLEQAKRLADSHVPLIVIDDAPSNTDSSDQWVHPESPAVCIFTSGSTGRPKALLRSHRDLAHAIYCISKSLCRYSCEDRMLTPGSPGHVGSLNDVLCCLIGGFMSIPIDVSQIELSQMGELAVAHGISVLALPPSLLRAFLPVLAAHAENLRLRIVVTSGEALQPRDIRTFFSVFPEGVELWQNYGSTETGPIYTSQYYAADAATVGPLPLRQAHEGCTVEIVQKDGQATMPGDVGRVRVHSRYVASGYLHPNDVQDSKFDLVRGERCFWTGDTGHIPLDGELHIHGRSDRQLNVHGRRLDVCEVESVAQSHPNICECVLVAIDKSREGTLVLAVNLVDESEFIVSELQDLLASKLPAFAIPRRIVKLSAMPRTPSGKLDYRKVQVLVEQQVQSSPIRKGDPPMGRLENWIADCWQEVLGIERPRREESFANLGGDSLAAIQLSWMLESRFGIHLPVDRLAEQQTIANQASYGARVESIPEVPLVALRDDHVNPVVIMLPGLGGHAWVFAELCRHFVTPARYQAVSYPAVLDNLKESISREKIAQFLADNVRKISVPQQDSPQFLIGYSLGGLIACDIFDKIQSRESSNVQLILIDPAPIAQQQSRSAMRQELHRLSRLLLRGRSSSKVPEHISLFEADLERNVSRLAQAYRSARLVLPQVGCHLLLSQDFQSRLRTGQVCINQEAMPTPTIASCGHLDLLRFPQATKTAAWIDNILRRSTEC